MSRIVLFGMKHCGKSALGKELSRRYSCEFFDLDRLIEDELAEETGNRISIRAAFFRLGEDGFRAREERTIHRLSKELGDKSYVLSLGGRTPLNLTLANPLKAMGLNVYIRIDPKEAWRRVSRSGIPAFLTGDDPEKEFLDLYREREPVYENQADLIVGLSRAPLSQNTDILQSKIEELMHAR